MALIKDPISPRRDELAKFLGNDARLIQTFEQLFALVPSEFNDIDDQIQWLIDTIATSQATANNALALFQTISEQLQVIANGPVNADPVEPQCSFEPVRNPIVSNDNWVGNPLALINGGTGASDAATARTNLGLGSLAVKSSIDDSDWSGTPLSIANGGTGASDAATARTNLGLGSLATQSSIDDSDWSGTELSIVNGGTGASDATTARTNLGLGSLATQSSIDDSDWSGTPLSIANGGTGASDAATARSNLGINNPAPVSATSPGQTGEFAYDNDYFYVCVAVDTWVRGTLTSF